jgi:hypothetical protein
MSIVAMKNKSRGYNNPISGINHTGFALNGTLRNQGYIGQDSISRKYIRTPFKGNTPVGHGGHLGSYPVTIIFSCSGCSNDPTIIKKSTMNNLGHIYSSILYPTNKSKCIGQTVSSPSTHENTAGSYISSQTDYIQTLRTTKDPSCISSSSDLPKINNCNNNNKCGSYSKLLTSISSGDYMNFILYNKKCVPK